mgnify:CR=1 FL=1
MRKMLIILVSTVVTALNINSYGELDSKLLENAKLMANTQKEIVLKKSINWSLGSTIFKLIHFAEIMFISEISRRRLNH